MTDTQREIKFRAWDKNPNCPYPMIANPLQRCDAFDVLNKKSIYKDWVLMQFTGLLDKNGVAEIYEGDIIDVEGIIKGNIYESPQIYKKGIDCLIEGMGTEKWRNTESVAMGLGCKYAK